MVKQNAVIAERQQPPERPLAHAAHDLLIKGNLHEQIF
jgi:hypothetical protein